MTRRGKRRRLHVDQRPAPRHHRQNLHKNMASGQRQLTTHPSQRRNHHAHELINDYRKWSLPQQIKTRSRNLWQHHHHHHHHHHRLRKISTGTATAVTASTGTAPTSIATTGTANDWYNIIYYSNDYHNSEFYRRDYYIQQRLLQQRLQKS